MSSRDQRSSVRAVIVRVDNTRRAQFAARTRPGGRPRRRSPRLRSASVSRALSALGMARHSRGAAGAWAPRRGNEEERLPLVSDADADARSAPHHPAGVRGDGASSLFSRGGARFAIRAAYAVALLATLSALAFAGWHRGAARVGAVDATGSPFPAVAHEIWLGDAMPEVKRLLFERNKALLEGLGWRVRLWGLDDVTRENFPATYDALRRGADSHRMTFRQAGCPVIVQNRIAYGISSCSWGVRSWDRMPKWSLGASDFPRTDLEAFESHAPHWGATHMEKRPAPTTILAVWIDQVKRQIETFALVYGREHHGERTIADPRPGARRPAQPGRP